MGYETYFSMQMRTLHARSASVFIEHLQKPLMFANGVHENSKCFHGVSAKTLVFSHSFCENLYCFHRVFTKTVIDQGSSLVCKVLSGDDYHCQVQREVKQPNLGTCCVKLVPRLVSPRVIQIACPFHICGCLYL